MILSFNTGTKFTKNVFVLFHFVLPYIPVLISQYLFFSVYETCYLLIP